MTRKPAAWSIVAAVTVAVGWALGAVGLPSSYLFAALLVGLATSLLGPWRLSLGPRAFTAAQAVTGVVLGAYLHADSLRAVGHSWPMVLLVSVGTLGVCLLAGAVLARATAVDETTAQLGMVAGGASGIVAMARDLGGDDRLVAFMQYARVLIVVLVTPVLAGLLFPGGHGTAAAAGGGPVLGTPWDWLITLACAVAGVVAGRAVRLPAAALLGPMAIAGTLTLTSAVPSFTVPPLLREAAFIGIGLQVGLRFTADTVRAIGRLVLPVFVAVAALIVACFGLAAMLHATTDVSLEDAYLATTPGGLYAVLAVAFGAGANTTFILAVQGLRLLVMVLLAPVIVRAMRRPRARARSGGRPPQPSRGWSEP